MSFQSRRLRVQLPCASTTVVDRAQFDCPMGTQCPGGSFVCDPSTCVFGEFSQVGPDGLCNAFSNPDPFCAGGSNLPVEPGPILIDPELLPVLREQVEAQLKEVRAAEQALREREAGGGS